MHQIEAAGHLTSIQVSLPQVHSDAEGDWTTGFYKTPVPAAVTVAKLGIAGDGVADTKHHGGLDKAILAYSVDHYPQWSHMLGCDLPYGAFGENLSVAGIDEANVCLGDHWQVGNVVLQVSQPRQPCWKLGRRWQQKQLPKQVIQNGRSGWYFRVIREGEIVADTSITLVSRAEPSWTIARANEVFYQGTQGARQELANVDALAESWKRELRK